MLSPEDTVRLLHGATVKRREGFDGERFDAVVSYMASRTGAPKDAWAVDHRAHMNALDSAKRSGVGHFVLLSAICVQRPLLAFAGDSLRSDLPRCSRKQGDRFALAAWQRDLDFELENLS